MSVGSRLSPRMHCKGDKVQNQFGPPSIAVAVRPAGKVSVTVTSSVVVESPEFVTASV